MAAAAAATTAAAAADVDVHTDSGVPKSDRVSTASTAVYRSMCTLSFYLFMYLDFLQIACRFVRITNASFISLTHSLTHFFFTCIILPTYACVECLHELYVSASALAACICVCVRVVCRYVPSCEDRSYLCDCRSTSMCVCVCAFASVFVKWLCVFAFTILLIRLLFFFHHWPHPTSENDHLKL